MGTRTDTAEAKLSRASVEYNLAEHCNLSCYGCDHASPLLPKRFASLDEFVRDLSALATVFHAGELRLVGGEPLLHPQLVDFLHEARRSGVADRLVVYTNGALLHRMPVAFWEGVDDLRLSLYESVTLPLSVEACALICRDHGIRFEADAKHGRFQRSLLNQRMEEPGLVRQVFERCEMARGLACHAIHEGRFYLCPVAPFQRARLSLLGIDFDNRETDGVRLHDNPHLREELARALAATEPLKACDFCLGTCAPWAPQRQLDEAGKASWLAEDHRPLIRAVQAELGDQARSPLAGADAKREAS